MFLPVSNCLFANPFKSANAVQIFRHPLVLRVVRVGSQLLLTDGCECFKSVVLLFHVPIMPGSSSQGIAQYTGNYA